jgi:hypothetical protein
MKLHQIFEATYIGQKQKPMDPITIDMDDDDDEIAERLYNLFSDHRNADDYPIDDWSEADLEFAHLDDMMGYDVIYHVDGRFVLFDRHSGALSWAPPRTTEDKVLTAAGYYDDDDEDDWE